MTITNEIADMQTELSVLRATCGKLENRNAVLENERDMLRRELLTARAERDKFMLRSRELQTLIEQTSLSLVHGITRTREAIQASQEKELGVDEKSAPEFLRRNEIVQTTPAESENYRFGSGARPRISGVVRDDIVDPRLPELTLCERGHEVFPGRDDYDNLKMLAGRLGASA